MILRIIISYFTFLFSLSLYAQDNTHEFTLDNGLKLIVKEDHRAPVVVSSIWYKVGSSYEPGGITGISHALEHMMFKGTKRYPAGTFSTIIAENGGQENAGTSFDFTFYYQELENQCLATSFELEADRMRNLLLSAEEFNKEIKVVQEERRMRYEDNPQSLTRERLYAAAYLAAPYHHLPIGWMNDLVHMKARDLRIWYNSWYAPNNAILVVVGDVNPTQVYQLAQDFFAAIPATPLATVKPQAEPPPLGQRHVVVNAPAELPLLLMAYNTPSLVTAEHTWQAYALEVTTAILAGGNSARLAKDLVRTQGIAVEADAGYDLFNRGESLFILSGIPGKDHTVDELKTAFLQQIKALQNELVSTQELTRIKTQVLAAETYAKDSLFNQAMEIGTLESIGLSWQIGAAYADNILAVTAEQVQKVAQRFLQTDRLTIAELNPLQIQNDHAD